ncbi:MAG TPA: hypothetical protein VL120_13380 [Solirubrobacteraceae bacterium]|nr:hypothetical protein [Solirubrobacteraceae bacterium]
MFDRIDPVNDTQALRDVVVIRPARDTDIAALHDLAELDSAAPLTGAVLVAIVDDRPWAALALDDGRVIADPFIPTAGAVELLRLRATQMRVAEGRVRRGGVALRGVRRARA